MSEKRMIKILHVFQSFNMGGLENGVINLINRTDPEIFEHEICCITASGTGEKRLERHVEIHQMGKREGNDWRMIPKLVRLIKARQPDLVHTRNWGSIDGIVAAMIAGVGAIIHSEHGWNMDDPQGRLLRRRLIRRILGFGVDRFVAVSEDINDWLHKSMGIRGEKIKTIINGVDTDKFFPGTNIELKRKDGADDDVVIGIVSRLDPIKRHDLLFRAFSRLDHHRYPLKMLVIGDGVERSNLEALLLELPHSQRIMMLGEHDNISEFYRQMDIFILPSQNEGISNTILEAMASGLPVVATAVGGNKELIDHDRTGRLIASNDEAAIVDAINYYLENPGDRVRHGANARSDAVNRFSLNRMIDEYEGLYRQMCFNFP